MRHSVPCNLERNRDASLQPDELHSGGVIVRADVVRETIMTWRYRFAVADGRRSAARRQRRRGGRFTAKNDGFVARDCGMPDLCGTVRSSMLHRDPTLRSDSVSLSEKFSG